MTAFLRACWLVLAIGAAHSCPSCIARTEMRQHSLAHIKQQILYKLGLQQAPNITGRPVPKIPPLAEYYDRMQADQPQIVEDHDEMDIKDEQIIAFAQPHQKLRHWRGKELLYFRFSDKSMGSKVKEATLSLYMRTGSQDESQTILLTLYKVTSSEPPLLVKFHEQKETRPKGNKGKWIYLNVKEIVSEWFKTSNENMRIAVQASIHGQESSIITQRLLVTSTHSETTSFVPFLKVSIADSRKQRTKRTIGLNCPENSDETRCCRYPLTVDFEEFGWDWVIAPKKYEANYCSGECPYVFLQKYPHTHLVHLANPSGTSGPCCAPRKMSSISMLYFDHDFNIIYGLLPGMVVDRCGCS